MDELIGIGIGVFIGWWFFSSPQAVAPQAPAAQNNGALPFGPSGVRGQILAGRANAR